MNKQVNETATNRQTNDLAAFLGILQRRLTLLAAVTLISVLIGAALSFFFLQPVYEAKTTLLVTRATQHLQAPIQAEDFNSVLQSVVRIPVLTMNTYVEQARSEILLLRVIESMNLGEQGVTVSSLARQVNVDVAKDSNLITIRVRNSDPALAVGFTNTINREYMLLIDEKNREIMEQSIKSMQNQVSLIQPKLTASPPGPEQDLLKQTLAYLEDRIKQTRVVQAIDPGSTGLVVLSPPLIPDHPVKPDKFLNLAMALILGLTFGILLSLLLEAGTINRAGLSGNRGRELARSWRNLLSEGSGGEGRERERKTEERQGKRAPEEPSPSPRPLDPGASRDPSPWKI